MTSPDLGQPHHPAAAGEAARTGVTPEAVVDQVYVQRAREGDLGAFDELVRKYQERIYATAVWVATQQELAAIMIGKRKLGAVVAQRLHTLLHGAAST